MGPGYFDLTLIHGARAVIVFAELKSDDGQLSPAQLAWFAATQAAALRTLNVQVYVWRPRHWTSGEIDKVLMEQ